MRYALIENNQVKDIFIEPEGFTIEECFVPEVASLYIPCPDNIAESDFYDSDTQEFTENPNKKYPNYSDWFDTLIGKLDQLNKYCDSLSTIINDFPMSHQRLDEYKTALSFVLAGVDDMVEIEGQQFTSDEFKLMINALKKFEEDKNTTKANHTVNINSFNNMSDIDTYDFTSGWPESIISI